MRTTITEEELETAKNAKEAIKRERKRDGEYSEKLKLYGGLIQSRSGGIVLQEKDVINKTILNKENEEVSSVKEIEYSISKSQETEISEATNLVRNGLVVIQQLRKEFQDIKSSDNFENKIADNLKAFKIKAPVINKTLFVEYEEHRLKLVKEYLETCLSNFSNFPEYHVLNSYLYFISNPIPEQHRKLTHRDIEILSLYHKKSIEYCVFECTVTDFVSMVENANFESLINKGKQAKIKRLIYVLSKNRDQMWYRQAANSFGCKPTDCSKANVSKDDRWRKAIEKIATKPT